MNNAATNEKAHAYELAGMGTGPYRFGGIFEMPTPSDGSAASFANGDPYAEIRALGLKAGAGTCACCEELAKTANRLMKAKTKTDYGNATCDLGDALAAYAQLKRGE